MPLITIQTFSGPEETVADVFGPWAIHAFVLTSRRPCGYQVTHVSSGFGLISGSGIPYKHARALVERLESSGLDWALPNGKADLTRDHVACGIALKDEFEVHCVDRHVDEEVTK